MVVDANTKLTDKQKVFADFYVGAASLNATRAADMAGYKGTYNALSIIGFKNLRLPHIRKYVDDRLAEIAASSSEVLTILGRQAKSTIGDLFDENGNFDLAEAKKRGLDSLIKKIPDPRKGAHDARYSMATKKIESLGWKPEKKFEQSLRETVGWFRDNERWWRPIIEGWWLSATCDLVQLFKQPTRVITRESG